MIALPGGTWLTLHYFAESAAEDFRAFGYDKKVRELLPSFEEDRLILQKVKFYNIPSAGKADAGSFLKDKVSWEGDVGIIPGELTLPEGVVKKLSEKKWAEASIDANDFDTSWMRELHNYDYWDIEKNSPVDPFKLSPHPSRLLLPSYTNLRTWARIRLLQGKLDNDLS